MRQKENKGLSYVLNRQVLRRVIMVIKLVRGDCYYNTTNLQNSFEIYI
jgi:hypothetical protein